jgi:hypothetical protein
MSYGTDTRTAHCTAEELQHRWLACGQDPASTEWQRVHEHVLARWRAAGEAADGAGR